LQQRLKTGIFQAGCEMTEHQVKRINGVSDALADVSLEMDDFVASLLKDNTLHVQRRRVCKKLLAFGERLGTAALDLQEVRHEIGMEGVSCAHSA
jgi:hypothetical protein